MTNVPPSVNWHLWPWCNFRCGYCFQPPAPGVLPLSRAKALRVPRALAEAGVEKLTFVGGEPTLCPHLGELVREAKDCGMTTMLVTNGSRLAPVDLASWAGDLDWLCVSIDTFNGDRAARIGRGDAGAATRGAELLREAHRLGMRTKVNTVVNALNWDDDLREGIARIAPDRWKVFRFLHVPGTNDSAVAGFAVTDEQFEAFRRRHAGLEGVFEDNEDMRDSYAMLDAQGCFFQNSGGGYVLSASVLEVGVHRAFDQVIWCDEKFRARGGIYLWTR